QQIVVPPAGVVRGGDSFLLTIADRLNAVVVSNDSFAEFVSDYPWLTEPGRLLGATPVKGVGWVFSERRPVQDKPRSQPRAKPSRRSLATRLSRARSPAPAPAARPASSAPPQPLDLKSDRQGET